MLGVRLAAVEDQREPAGSILRDFDLSVIRRYFPEYDQTFKR